MKSLKLSICKEILNELDRAERLHPVWPDDIIHAVAIMNEESGEAIRAALNCVYEGATIKDVQKELIHTAAMCVRCLININPSL